MLPISRKLKRINWRFRVAFDPDRGGVVEFAVFALVIIALATAGLAIINWPMP